MKYTDKFFTIPIRIYNGRSIIEAIQEEIETNIPTPSEYVVGARRLQVKDITAWADGYGEEDKLEDIREHGFTCTIVETGEEDSFLCHWNRKKFEEELNKFMEKVEQK